MDKEFLDRVVEKYQPEFAMAYGSGVFHQNGYGSKEKPMVDFVFGVSDPARWHERNAAQNQRDYARMIRIMPATVLGKIQEWGPGLFYNPFVNFEDRTIKYGVVSLQKIKRDLLNWETLYVAGRLHKPTKIVKSNEEIESAQKKNLESALNAATFILPEKFSDLDLFKTLAGLSYKGDARMAVGENRNKVANIVENHLGEFEQLYDEAIKKAEWLARRSSETFVQNNSAETLEARFRKLPFTLRAYVPPEVDITDKKQTRLAIEKAIRQITFRPSLIQSLKGIITAGPMRATQYAAAKVAKAWI